ncbi:MAG: pilus assembly protein [Chloroflexi bacterium]|nr:pilus assembly protein [Chloroflexota bacterium]
MRNALQKILLFIRPNPQRTGKKHKSPGQSMVEFAILLPVLMILFSGMVEYGFMLNTYLSLLDATRQAARLCSNGQPFLVVDTSTDPATYTDDPAYLPGCAHAVTASLDPSEIDPDSTARQIVLDSVRDDVLISVLSVSVTVDEDTGDSVVSIQRHPEGTYHREYGNQITKYSDAAIVEYMTQNGTTPVESGILIVEVYYGYKGILGLPWLKMFMSPDDPVMLHASTIMPLVAAKP